MLMPEEFERCECGEGWVERRVISLISKGSPKDAEPNCHVKKVQYICVECGSIKCQYNEEV